MILVEWYFSFRGHNLDHFRATSPSKWWHVFQFRSISFDVEHSLSSLFVVCRHWRLVAKVRAAVAKCEDVSAIETEYDITFMFELDQFDLKKNIYKIDFNPFLTWIELRLIAILRLFNDIPIHLQ